MPGPIASLRAALTWDLGDFDRGTRHIEGSFGRLRSMVNDLAASFDQLANRMTLGITVPLAGLAVYTVKAASDVQELQSAFDYTFGAMAGRMNKWADETGDAMGRATQEMQRGALAFGGMFKEAAANEAAAARLSQQFAQLAQDAASFYNTDFETAMGKIRSGLSGESEPLRDFNVFLTEAAVKARALELGLIKTGEELSEQGKIMARASLIMEGLGDAQGDVERTSSSLANRLRALRAEFQEMASEIGNRLLPVSEMIAEALANLLSWVRGLPAPVKNAIGAMAAFAAAIGPVLKVIGILAVTFLPLLLVKMGGLFLVVSAIINPIGTAIVVLGKWALASGAVTQALAMLARGATAMLGPWGLAAAAVLLFSENITKALGEVWETAQRVLGPQFAQMLDNLVSLITSLGEAFANLGNSPIGQFLGEIIDYLGKLIEGLILIGGDAVIASINSFLTKVNMIGAALNLLMERANEFLASWQSAWDGISETVRNAVSAIGDYVKAVIPGIYNLMSVVNGVVSYAEQRSAPKPTSMGVVGLARWAVDATEEMVDRFGGSSASAPPKSYAVGGGGGGGRKGRSSTSSGPSAEELASRRKDIELQQALAIARERNDIAAERSLQRQIDLKALIERYENAGLKAAEARLAAEKDLAELDVARAEARARELARDERSFEIQLAQIREDNRQLTILRDREFIESEIARLRDLGLSAAEAEIEAQERLLALDRARADANGRRAADQERERQIELARLRGDDPAQIRAMEEDIRRRARARELTDEYGLSDEDARAQAIAEGLDRERAAITGTFRDTFRAGLRAALDGDLGGFFKNWLQENMYNALSRVLDRLADALANLISGNSGGGGDIFSAIGSIFSGMGGRSESGAGGFSVDTREVHGFATGGAMRIGGLPGIDRNLLSLNGRPLARVSQGEILNITPSNDRGGAGGANFHFDLRGAVMTQDLLDQMNRIGQQAAFQGGQIGSQGAQAAMARQNDRRLA